MRHGRGTDASTRQLSDLRAGLGTAELIVLLMITWLAPGSDESKSVADLCSRLRERRLSRSGLGHRFQDERCRGNEQYNVELHGPRARSLRPALPPSSEPCRPCSRHRAPAVDGLGLRHEPARRDHRRPRPQATGACLSLPPASALRPRCRRGPRRRPSLGPRPASGSSGSAPRSSAPTSSGASSSPWRLSFTRRRRATARLGRPSARRPTPPSPQPSAGTASAPRISRALAPTPRPSAPSAHQPPRASEYLAPRRNSRLKPLSRDRGRASDVLSHNGR